MALLDPYYSSKDEPQLKAKTLGRDLARYRKSTFIPFKNFLVRSLKAKSVSSFRDMKCFSFKLPDLKKIKTCLNSTKEFENFGEFIGQLSTVEAMIAVLELFPNDYVEVAHPTQTSMDSKRRLKAGVYDHDLVLRGPGNLKCIEVSHVIATSGDTNQKLARDLTSLYRSYKKIKKIKKNRPKVRYLIMTSDKLWEHHRGDRVPVKSFLKRFGRIHKNEVKIYAEDFASRNRINSHILIHEHKKVKKGFALLEIDFTHIR